MLTEKQHVMERRYSLPYNWLEKPYSIKWAHKFGLISIILKFIQSGDRVLDVGCGDGWHSSMIAEKGAIVTGIDYSERAIGFARLINPASTFDIGSATTLPYPDKSFDVVTCIQVLEHLDQTSVDQALAEFKRVIKDKGRIIISVPSILRPLSKAHLRHYTIQSLRDMTKNLDGISTLKGHELSNAMSLNMRKLFENRIFFSQIFAKIFYEKIYFRYFNEVDPQKANNLIICCNAPQEPKSS